MQPVRFGSTGHAVLSMFGMYDPIQLLRSAYGETSDPSGSEFLNMSDSRISEFFICGASDIGKRRSRNEDHFLVASLRRQLIVEQTDVSKTLQHQLFGCHEGKLLMVADGMGGHQGGEIASRTAIETSARYVLDMMHWFLKLSQDDEQDFEDELSDCLTSVQQKIWSDGGAHSRQMGTTVTMAYVLWPRMFVIHAGGSRCYLMRDGEYSSLSSD